MNNSTPILITTMILLIIVFIIWIIPTSRCLEPKNFLVQPNSFYKSKRQNTIDYLSAVYPTAKDKLNKMHHLDLATFYNSLWFYYNCESAFSRDLSLPRGNNVPLQTTLHSCWKAIPGCGNKWPKLPYTPQGYIYSFIDWLNGWTPFIDSKSDIDPSKITGSFPGQTFTNFYDGPSPIWMYQRAIFRMVYNTNLPIFDGSDKIPQLLPGPIGDWESGWKYPEKWWLGVPSNGYIEVTAASEPGMANSPPMCWVDGWPGSGLFLSVGKTFIARNKGDGCFLLAVEMSKTVVGKQKLIEWWKTDDPYEIMKNLLYLTPDNFIGINGPTIWDQFNKVKIPLCNITMNNQFNPRSLPYLPTNQTPGAPSVNADYGFWGTPNFYVNDFYEWCQKAKDENSDKIPDSCIDDIRFGRTYRADRITNTTIFDEPMFAMALWLGYDTVQLTQSANGADFWQYEILVLYDYPQEAKNRDYSSFMEFKPPQNTCPAKMGTLQYRKEFAVPYMKTVYRHFTLRDPFDVNNNSRAVAAIPGAIYPTGWEYNITAKNNLSDIFTQYAVIGQPNDQCKPGYIGH
jgi:hypothetical protein